MFGWSLVCLRVCFLGGLDDRQKSIESGPKSDPKSIKNQSKIDVKRKPEENTRKSKNEQPSCIFACFLMSAGVKISSKIDPKSVQKLIKKTMHKTIDFGSDFGSILEPSWGSKTLQNRSKTGSKTRAKLSRRRTLVRQQLRWRPGRWGPRWPCRARTGKRKMGHRNW